MVSAAPYIKEPDKGKYSDLMVLQSAAGYYIGTLYTEDGFTEPGSRDSEYFPTQAAAEEELRKLSGLGPEIAASFLRDSPETK